MSLVISIGEMLKKLPPAVAECSIYRVPERLLNIKRIAYIPQIISIGPLHHGQKNLMAMEQLKLRSFNSYLHRIDKTLEDVVEAARGWESRARSCYAEPINMKIDDFVKMLLMDGCFIVEFMIMVYGEFPKAKKELDPLFYKSIGLDLYRDLTKLENQLPFFVLVELFQLYRQPTSNNDANISFVELAHNFFVQGSCIEQYMPLPGISRPEDVKHLVDFISFYYVPMNALQANKVEPSGMNQLNLTSTEIEVEPNGMKQLNRTPTEIEVEPRETDELIEDDDKNQMDFPPTATELWEAGVIFRRPLERNITGIRFENGFLEIPPFQIDDCYETYIRNLMAFEPFSDGNNQRYVINYVVFLDRLINTENDVNLLVKAKILTNNIGGSNEEISKLFNDLCKDVIIEGGFYYADTCINLQNYCRRRRHLWMTSLRRKHFNSPWACISIVAASFLLLLTFLQTLFTIMSYSMQD